ncbi:hypothetical protein NKG05_02620 [Oerskovia sp. M15]
MTMLGQLVLGGIAIAVWIGLDVPANVVLLLVAVLGDVRVRGPRGREHRVHPDARVGTALDAADHGPGAPAVRDHAASDAPAGERPDPGRAHAPAPRRGARDARAHRPRARRRCGGLRATFALAAQPLAILLAWCLAGAWLAVRYTRWEPRR